MLTEVYHFTSEGPILCGTYEPQGKAEMYSDDGTIVPVPACFLAKHRSGEIFKFLTAKAAEFWLMVRSGAVPA